MFPSATEIVGALGLVDSLVGVSYECDFPRGVVGKPVVVNTRLPATDDPAEIDEHVREFYARGESPYRIESDILRKGEPDLILTQELCEVCAATLGDLGSALRDLAVEPQVLSLHPHRIEHVLDDILAVGEVTERVGEAHRLIAGLRDRLAVVANQVDGVAFATARLVSGVDRPADGGRPLGSRNGTARGRCRCFWKGRKTLVPRGVERRFRGTARCRRDHALWLRTRGRHKLATT